MLEFRSAMRSENDKEPFNNAEGPAQPTLSPSARAAHAQNSGFSRVDALMAKLSAGSIDPDAPGPMTGCVPGPSQTAEERANAEHRAREEDERIVDAELKRYEAGGPVRSPNFDLLRYWEVRTAYSYPEK